MMVVIWVSDDLKATRQPLGRMFTFYGKIYQNFKQFDKKTIYLESSLQGTTKQHSLKSGELLGKIGQQMHCTQLQLQF